MSNEVIARLMGVDHVLTKAEMAQLIEEVRADERRRMAAPTGEAAALREALDLALKHFVPEYGSSESGIRPEAAARIRRLAATPAERGEAPTDGWTPYMEVGTGEQITEDPQQQAGPDPQTHRAALAEIPLCSAATASGERATDWCAVHGCEWPGETGLCPGYLDAAFVRSGEVFRAAEQAAEPGLDDSAWEEIASILTPYDISDADWEAMRAAYYRSQQPASGSDE